MTIIHTLVLLIGFSGPSCKSISLYVLWTGRSTALETEEVQLTEGASVAATFGLGSACTAPSARGGL